LSSTTCSNNSKNIDTNRKKFAMKFANLLNRQGMLCVLLAVLFPQWALAHDGASLPYGSFIGGLTHPVLGADHFLAMVSVGILSAQIGGRAIWTIPCTFVAVMAFGGVLGFIDIGLTAIEAGIAISVLALGIAIASDRKLPMSIAMTAIGFSPSFMVMRTARKCLRSLTQSPMPGAF
jgi:hydrogenase/urease accessory protein HupE